MAFAICLAIKRTHVTSLCWGCAYGIPPVMPVDMRTPLTVQQVMGPRSHPHDRAGTSSNHSLDTIIDFVLDRQLYLLDNFGFTRFRSVLHTTHTIKNFRAGGAESPSRTRNYRRAGGEIPRNYQVVWWAGSGGCSWMLSCSSRPATEAAKNWPVS